MGLKKIYFEEKRMSLQKKYYIGEFSEITGISKRMLRHYDKIGLFCPVDLNESNGYRFYCDDQIVDLNKIQYLRDIGFTLSQVKDLLSKPIELSNFLEILKEKELMLDRESDEIKSSLLLTKRTILHLENQSSKIYPSINQLLDIEGSMTMENKGIQAVDLNKLMNRDLFMEKIEDILKFDKEDHYHFLTFDIDNFMHVNDFDGYAVGDAVIQHVISTIVTIMNPLIEESETENFVSRLGGDECSVFLKNVEDEKVIKYVDRIFESIRNYDFREIGCQRKITITCGVAHGNKPVHVAHLKDQSSKALMDSKRSGRDKYKVINY